MKIFKTPIGMIRKNIKPIAAIVVVTIAIVFSSIALAAQSQDSDLQVTTERPTTSPAETIEPITVQPTTQPTTVLSTTQPPTTQSPTTEPPTTQPPTTQAEEPEVYEDDYDEEEEIYKENPGSYYGMFTLTAYCPCYECSEGYGNANAYGGTCVQGRTVACNVLPYGTRIYIEGYGEYVVEDVGGGLGNSKIDIYFDYHRGNFKDYRAVYILD